MNFIKRILLNPKIYIALGTIVMFIGCIVGKHNSGAKYIFPNPEFYQTMILLFGGYIVVFIFTVIDAKKIKQKT